MQETIMTYENQRVHFDKMLKSYKSYLDLYKFFNHGSLKGATPFADFYWLHHYFFRHKKVNSLGSRSAL